MLTIETELALQLRVFVFGFRALFRGCCKGIAAAGQAAGKKMNWAKARSQQELVDIVEDPADPSERVPAWQWGPGLLATIICICAVMGSEFDMPVGMSLLSVVLAFLFSFLAIQCTGVTGKHVSLSGNWHLTNFSLLRKTRHLLRLLPKPLKLSLVVRRRASTGELPMPKNSTCWAARSQTWARYDSIILRPE